MHTQPQIQVREANGTYILRKGDQDELLSRLTFLAEVPCPSKVKVDALAM